MGSALFFRHQTFVYAARSLGLVVPERLWYRAVFRLCRMQAVLLPYVIRLSHYRKDPRRKMMMGWLMDSWLRELAALGRPFPIPIRIKGAEAIFKASGNSNGMVICSLHLPLAHILLRSLVDLGCPPRAIVANKSELKDSRCRVWGSRVELQGFVPNSVVLLRVRNILRRGGSVFALVDEEFGGVLQPNLFRLIRSVGARAVFMVAELQSDGEILVECFPPPNPFCESDGAISENMQILQGRIDLILRPHSRGPHAPNLPGRETKCEPAVPAELSEPTPPS